MAEKHFRVLLDVTELYNENLKYVWVNVSPLQLKTISDFKVSIREKLSLGNNDIKIFVREGLLLDEETIIVLRENDTVKVQYKELCPSTSKNPTKEQNKCPKKRNYSECADDVIDNLKMCKIDNISDEINDSVPSRKKHKKLHNSQSTDNIISHVESLEEHTDIVAERHEKKNKKGLKMPENYVDSCENQTSEDSGNGIHSHSLTFEKNNSDVIKKHKKKDKRKSYVLEMNTEDTNTNNDTFLSFVNVDPTVTQLENISTSAVTVDPETLKNDSNKSSQNSNDISEVDVKTSAVTGKSSQKKKRKRRRKRKHTVSGDIDVSQNVDADKFVSFSNDIEELKMELLDLVVAPKILENPVTKSKSISFSNNEESVKRTHIVYSPVPSEAEEKPVEIHNNMKEIHNSSNNTYVVNEDISAVNSQSFKNYPQVSTPNQPNKCKNLSWHVSLMQSTHSVTNNQPKMSEKDFTNVAEKQSFAKRNCSKKEKISNIECGNLASLNSFPEIGTHIMYKVLELDDSYSPVVSEYREGLVKGVNHDTQEIEIELLKEVVKPGRTGKFENLKEDENPSPEVIRCDTVQWSSLISPKRMY